MMSRESRTIILAYSFAVQDIYGPERLRDGGEGATQRIDGFLRQAAGNTHAHGRHVVLRWWYFGFTEHVKKYTCGEFGLDAITLFSKDPTQALWFRGRLNS